MSFVTDVLPEQGGALSDFNVRVERGCYQIGRYVVKRTVTCLLLTGAALIGLSCGLLFADVPSRNQSDATRWDTFASPWLVLSPLSSIRDDLRVPWAVSVSHAARLSQPSQTARQPASLISAWLTTSSLLYAPDGDDEAEEVREYLEERFGDEPEHIVIAVVDIDAPGTPLSDVHLQDFSRFSQRLAALSVSTSEGGSSSPSPSPAAFERGLALTYEHVCARRVLADGVAMPCERYSALDCFQEGSFDFHPSTDASALWLTNSSSLDLFAEFRNVSAVPILDANSGSSSSAPGNSPTTFEFLDYSPDTRPVSVFECGNACFDHISSDSSCAAYHSAARTPVTALLGDFGAGSSPKVLTMSVNLRSSVALAKLLCGCPSPWSTALVDNVTRGGFVEQCACDAPSDEVLREVEYQINQFRSSLTELVRANRGGDRDSGDDSARNSLAVSMFSMSVPSGGEEFTFLISPLSGFVVLLLFVLFTIFALRFQLCRCGHIGESTHVAAALCALVVLCLTVSAALGFAALVGVLFTPSVVQVFPLVALAHGFRSTVHVFHISNNRVLQSRDPEDHVGSLLKIVGVPLLMNTGFHVTVSALLMFVPFEEASNFALVYLVFSVTLLASILFGVLPLITWDVRRLEDDRVDVLCCWHTLSLQSQWVQPLPSAHSTLDNSTYRASVVRRTSTQRRSIASSRRSSLHSLDDSASSQGEPSFKMPSPVAAAERRSSFDVSARVEHLEPKRPAAKYRVADFFAEAVHTMAAKIVVVVVIAGVVGVTLWFADFEFDMDPRALAVADSQAHDFLDAYLRAPFSTALGGGIITGVSLNSGDTSGGISSLDSVDYASAYESLVSLLNDIEDSNLARDTSSRSWLHHLRAYAAGIDGQQRFADNTTITEGNVFPDDSASPSLFPQLLARFHDSPFSSLVLSPADLQTSRSDSGTAAAAAAASVLASRFPLFSVPRSATEGTRSMLERLTRLSEELDESEHPLVVDSLDHRLYAHLVYTREHFAHICFTTAFAFTTIVLLAVFSPFYMLICVASTCATLVGLFGLLWFLGFAISAPFLTSFLFASATVFEFSAIYSRYFLITLGDRSDRTVETLREVAEPHLFAAIGTVVALLPLASFTYEASEFFGSLANHADGVVYSLPYYHDMWFLVPCLAVGAAVANSMVFLPALHGLFGPSGLHSIAGIGELVRLPSVHLDDIGNVEPQMSDLAMAPTHPFHLRHLSDKYSFSNLRPNTPDFASHGGGGGGGAGAGGVSELNVSSGMIADLDKEDRDLQETIRSTIRSRAAAAGDRDTVRGRNRGWSKSNALYSSEGGDDHYPHIQMSQVTTRTQGAASILGNAAAAAVAADDRDQQQQQPPSPVVRVESPSLEVRNLNTETVAAAAAAAAAGAGVAVQDEQERLAPEAPLELKRPVYISPPSVSVELKRPKYISPSVSRDSERGDVSRSRDSGRDVSRSLSPLPRRSSLSRSTSVPPKARDKAKTRDGFSYKRNNEMFSRKTTDVNQSRISSVRSSRTEDDMFATRKRSSSDFSQSNKRPMTGYVRTKGLFRRSKPSGGGSVPDSPLALVADEGFASEPEHYSRAARVRRGGRGRKLKKSTSFSSAQSLPHGQSRTPKSRPRNPFTQHTVPVNEIHGLAAKARAAADALDLEAEVRLRSQTHHVGSGSSRFWRKDSRTPSSPAASQRSSPRSRSSRSRPTRSPTSSRRTRPSRKDSVKSEKGADSKRKKKSRRPRHPSADPYARTHSEPHFPVAAATGVFPPPTYAFASAPVPYHPAMGTMYAASYSPYVHPHGGVPPPPSPGAGGMPPHAPAGYAPVPVPLHHQIPLGYPNPYLDRHSSLASLNNTSRDDSHASRPRSKRTKSNLSGPSMTKKHYKSMPGPISPTRGRSISPTRGHSNMPQLSRPISSASQVQPASVGSPGQRGAAIHPLSHSNMRAHDMSSRSISQHGPTSGMIDHNAYNGVAPPGMPNGPFAHFAPSPYAHHPTSAEYAAAYGAHAAASYSNLMAHRDPNGHSRSRRRRRDYVSSGSDGDSYSDEDVLSGEGEHEDEALSSSSEYEYPPGEEPHTLKYNRRSTEERRRNEREREKRRPRKQRQGREAAERPHHRRSHEPLDGYTSDPDHRRRDRDRERRRSPEAERLGRPPKPLRLTNKKSPRSTASSAKSQTLSRDSRANNKHTKRHERQSSAESVRSQPPPSSPRSPKVLGASSRPCGDREGRRLESQQRTFQSGGSASPTQKREKSPKSLKNSWKSIKDKASSGSGSGSGKQKIPSFNKSHSAATPKTAGSRKSSSPDTLQRPTRAMTRDRRSSAPVPPTELKAASSVLGDEADSASDDNEGDVVDGETAFWDLIESSQITRDGVVNKPRKKPAASMTHPSTCGKDSLSRHSQDSRQSGKKVSPSSDSSKKKSRVELEQEWRKQRKQSSRSVSPPSKSSNSRSLEDPAAGSVPDTSSSPRSRFFSRRKRSQSPGGTVKKYGTMREKGGGFLRSRSRSRHKKTSSLEGEVDGIDLAEPKNTGKPSPRSHSAAPRRSPFSAQRKSPLASGAGAGDANKLSPQESEAATTRGTSPRNRPGGGGVRGLLRRLSRDSQYNDDLKPEDPTTDDVGAGGATSSSGQSQTPPQKPLPSMPAGGAKGGAQDKFSLRVHAGGDPSNEPSRSSSAAARHLAPTGSGHTRTLSIAAHEPNEHSPVLGTKSAPSSSSGAAARLIPDPSLRAKRAKVVHVPPVASMDSMGADPARPQLHTHHSSGLSALNTPPSDLSRPSSRKGSTSSSRGVTLVKSRRASRDPGGAVLLPTSAPVLQASASAPPVSGGGSLAASSGVPDAPPSPAPSSSASSTGSKSRSLRRPIVTV